MLCQEICGHTLELLCYNDPMAQISQSQTPIEPARSILCTLTLTEWTPEGLARGALAADADERLPAGTPIAVLGGIPGETVEVEVAFLAIWRRKQQKRPKPPIIRLVRIITPAPERVAAPCPYFGDCGGCRLQHLPYEKQLGWKRDRVMAEIAAVKLDGAVVRPTLGMEHPWNFRNQMRFAVNREGQPGLTAYGTHRVIPMATCPIAHPLINTTLGVLRQEVNPRPQVLIRCGANTGEVLVQPTPATAASARLVAANIDLHADGLREQLGGLTFHMHPSSFFQTNTAQAEVMVSLVLANVPAGPTATIADAYCGVGTFAALLATHAGHVIAIEESASAVRDARANLAALDMMQVEVLQGKTEQVLPTVTRPIDAIVLDPPRMGCMRPTLDAIITRAIPRIVYVSCDPATLARDLAIFVASGRYRLVSVQPLDMFPQTHHIECVAVLDSTDTSPAEK
jgi:23S rRNA (uracil1939-C5)-methyltransferase